MSVPAPARIVVSPKGCVPGKGREKEIQRPRGEAS